MKYITLCLLAIVIFAGCASRGAASAEEYFAIGMAYYDIGKFAEAEKWLNRAKAKDRTKSASEYNLGRIAFELDRYEDAAKHFESILKRDPRNVLALKAAAYTQIRLGDLKKASALYDRLLALVPESADDGYNYALVLFAMEKYAEAEQVLKNHEFALLDNSDVLLLYARTQKIQNKPEAIDTFANWLINNDDAKVRYEYAQLLEEQELYARALEEYRAALESLTSSSVNPTKPELHFTIARVLLIADAGSTEGITELQEAVEEGFSDFDAIEALLVDERISAANRDALRTIVTEGRRTVSKTLSTAAGSDKSGLDDDTDNADDEEKTE
ncbi:MAG: tetratricopeptide repeat protein [Treponema sp.]|nr:tetratricopeptide repeat protein [Treponema sp.]